MKKFVIILAIYFAVVLLRSGSGQSANTNAPAPSATVSNAPSSEAAVDLTPSQTNAIKIATVGTSSFAVESTAIGSIDYDEDQSVQVFSPYQGKIITALAKLGDEVKKGQALYTIDSPDLIQAESTLIGAASTFDLVTKELARAKDLHGTNGISEREMEQATSDFQTAEGALKAARDAVRVFGKTEAETDQIVMARKIDPILVIPSPVTGRVTARCAQPGLLVQPGNVPAPYSVADLQTKWMVANVTESDSTLLHLDQNVTAKVTAWPGRVFTGKVSAIGAAIDPNTHRIMVRCEIADPKDELRPGMLANFDIRDGNMTESVALPANGVVRNGDGTMAAWVTADRLHFVQRIVKVGLQKDDQDQILEGLQPGELVVTDGAVFISNILYAPPSD